MRKRLPPDCWKRGIRLWLVGCVLVILMACQGCSRTEVVTRVEVVKMYPPGVLMLNTPIPQYAGSTHGDMIAYILDLLKLLRDANADKTALREWAHEGE